MADFVFNIAKGRVAELCTRVDTNDPTNSAIVVLCLAATGIETDAVLKDKDTITDLVSGTTNESTNTGYARKVLDDSLIGPFAPDDATDTFKCDIPDQTWTGVANDGTGNIGDFVTSYDNDTTAGTDANILPMTQHDFAITPDGSDVIAQINVAGFYSAA